MLGGDLVEMSSDKLVSSLAFLVPWVALLFVSFGRKSWRAFTRRSDHRLTLSPSHPNNPISPRPHFQERARRLRVACVADRLSLIAADAAGRGQGSAARRRQRKILPALLAAGRSSTSARKNNPKPQPTAMTMTEPARSSNGGGGGGGRRLKRISLSPARGKALRDFTALYPFEQQF